MTARKHVPKDTTTTPMEFASSAYTRATFAPLKKYALNARAGGS